MKPKQGTLERLVLDKLEDAGDRGVTQFDFDPPISEEQLAQAIANLQNGMFEAEDDGTIHGYHWR